jgi:hypothetical protein
MWPSVPLWNRINRTPHGPNPLEQADGRVCIIEKPDVYHRAVASTKLPYCCGGAVIGSSLLVTGAGFVTAVSIALEIRELRPEIAAPVSPMASNYR